MNADLHTNQKKKREGNRMDVALSFIQTSCKLTQRVRKCNIIILEEYSVKL